MAGRRSPFIVGAFLALSVSACSGGSSGPPSAPATARPTNAPTQSATATPGVTPTPAITPTPQPGHTSTPTPVAATPTPQPGHTSTPTPVPTATTPSGSGTSLVDWPTYAFDSARDGYNPSTTAFTPASLSSLHQVWNMQLVSGAQSQPVVATEVPGHTAVLILGTGNGYEEAVDGTTGAVLWTTMLGQQNEGQCGTGGVAGTAQYVASTGSVYAVAGNGGGSPNHMILYQLNVANGAIVNKLDLSTGMGALLNGESIAAHTSVTYANGLLYVGGGSNCEAASWRGQVVAVDPNTMTIANIFYTTWQQGGAYGGGGVWGWGGVSADPSGNIYVAGGNAETAKTIDSGTEQAPFVVAPAENSGYAENVVELNGAINQVLGSYAPVLNFSIGGKDLDLTGTPVVYQPAGCDTLVATQGKGGTLVVNDTAYWSRGAIGNYTFSEPSALANYMGNPGYSPQTGMLYAAISSGTDTAYQPGLAAIGSCGSNVAWHAQFGPDSFSYSSHGSTPRSAPVATAGGVVFAGTPCTANGSGGCGTPGALNGAIWAVDASAGTVLNGGNPVLVTGDNVRMAPTVDGQWMWVCDASGNLYGLTVNASIPAKARSLNVRHNATTLHWHGN